VEKLVKTYHDADVEWLTSVEPIAIMRLNGHEQPVHIDTSPGSHRAGVQALYRSSLVKAYRELKSKEANLWYLFGCN
jgi:hypothetical protein